ncbi:MAG TPA: zinc-binding dehydrogenase [Armatimonadota bacterium]|nr:zinc-binding dehydrogenase [Armatimonadota bacterium]
MAVVATFPWTVEFLPVEAPEPSDDDVVIRVTQSWISSGTEGSFIRGERIAGDTPRMQFDPPPFPHVPGYQKVGIVEWVGSRVAHVRPGDRVFATVSHVQGMFFDTGGHISPAVTHGSQVWKIPEGVEPLAVSGLVLTQVGYNCGVRPAMAAGDAAVVIGDGLVGHWAAQTLAWRGARVMLVGRHADRIGRFHRREQDGVVNSREEDPVSAAEAWAPDGLQVIVDTVGSIEAMENLYPITRRAGALVSAGFYGFMGQIDIQKMRDRELTLHAPSGWTGPRLDATLRLIASGDLQTLPLITHHFPANDAPQAYDLILNRQAPVLGVVLDWE